MFKSLGIFALLGIIFLIFPGNSLANEGTSEEFNAEENGYLEQYYVEKEENVDPESQVADPVVEEQIILEALEAYWAEDLEVAEILANALQDDSVKPLVLSTEKEDKIKAIELIKQTYENLNAEQQELLHYYVERHSKGIQEPEVEEYLGALDTAEKEYLETQEVFLESPSTISRASLSSATADSDGFTVTAASSGYNAAAAANWAFMNYNKYSTNYPKFTGSFGTNCTNFISQAMHVGGKIPKQGTWTISRKNTTHHVINSATQLNYSWKLTDPSPWISVKEFAKFWRPKSSTRTVTNAQYLHNQKNYQTQRVGDIVVFSKGAAGVVTVPTHAMIITQKTSTDFNLAGNSVERQKHPLKTAITAYQSIEFYRPN